MVTEKFKTIAKSIGLYTIIIYCTLLFCETVVEYFDLHFLVFERIHVHPELNKLVSQNQKTRNESRYEFYKKFVDKYPNAVRTLNPTTTYFSEFAKFSSFLPLTTASNSPAIMCNQDGSWQTFQSDELGFNNPIPNQKIVDLVMIGDSFTQGHCQPDEFTIAGQLRKKGLIVKNLGISGTGPIAQYAALREYLAVINTKKVFWFYFEGNDLDDFIKEKKVPVLMRYVEDKEFSQSLADNQVKLDADIRAFLNNKVFDQIRDLKASTKSEFFDFLTYHLALRRLSSTYTIAFRNYFESQVSPAAWPDNWEKETSDSIEVILAGKTLVEKNGAEFCFVFLPHSARYHELFIGGENEDFLYQQKQILEKELFPKLSCIVDMSLAFGADSTPLRFWAGGIWGHYSPAGYEYVGNMVAKELNDSTRK